MVFNENLLVNKELLKDLLRQVDVLNAINGGTIQTCVDVIGSLEKIVIKISAPSISVEDFSVLLNYSQLTVSIFPKQYEGVNDYVGATPLFVPMFMRTFDVPSFVDLNGIEAVHENNDLTITLPFKSTSEDFLRMIDIREL